MCPLLYTNTKVTIYEDKLTVEFKSGIEIDVEI